jgi:hypothetical protein
MKQPHVAGPFLRGDRPIRPHGAPDETRFRDADSPDVAAAHSFVRWLEELELLE